MEAYEAVGGRRLEVGGRRGKKLEVGGSRMEAYAARLEER